MAGTVAHRASLPSSRSFDTQLGGLRHGDGPEAFGALLRDFRSVAHAQAVGARFGSTTPIAKLIERSSRASVAGNIPARYSVALGMRARAVEWAASAGHGAPLEEVFHVVVDMPSRARQ